MNRLLTIKNFEEAMTFVTRAQDFMNAISTLSYPTIAAVNGFALGGGLEIALACDIRVASKTAIFGSTEAKYGVLPGAGGTQCLSRLIGTGRAKLLMYTGRSISAEQALEIGLVDKVMEPEQILSKSYELAEEIAANSPVAVRHIKKCVDEGIQLSLENGLAIERRLWAELIPYGDYMEVLAAAKREPEMAGVVLQG